MEQASIDYVRSAGSREGEFTITVADFGTETIRSYTIIQTYEPGLPEFMIFPEPTEMSIAAGFTEAINIKTDIQTLLTDIEVPIELSDSAYKLVNNSFNQNSVVGRSHFGSNQSWPESPELPSAEIQSLDPAASYPS